jgi:hypothetical protein
MPMVYSQVAPERIGFTIADGVGPGMRLAFFDCLNWDFHPQIVDSIPLGGTQSAACYLTRALAALGHEIFFFTGTSSPEKYDSVNCLSARAADFALLRSLQLDVFVCLLVADIGPRLRAALPAQTRLVLWTQHAADQPQVQSLRDPGCRGAFDAVALVSQ